MTDAEQAVANDTTSSLIEQLGNAIIELQTLKNASEESFQWIEIEEHFRNLETTLKEKFEELEAKEREFEEKEAETHTLVAETEALVTAQEQDILDRVQELKDAAVSAITEAREKHQPTSLQLIDGEDNQDSKVSDSIGDTNSPEEDIPQKTIENPEAVAVEVKPRPELSQFCEQMDAKGLLNYILKNQKKIFAIREELSVALESATEPARLVLDSLEGFYLPGETTQSGDQSNAALQGKRKTCIMFMEAMTALLARAESHSGGGDHHLNPETKQQAKAIADEWKPKLASEGIDAANGYSLEAEAFLQLLATFRIASEFDEEELCKLVLAVAHRRQTPELCRSLGLTHKMPDFVKSMVSSGRQTDAVRFIHAFGLTDQFPPVPLLKSYLKDLRRNLQEKGGNTGGAPGAKNDANFQELAALRTIIRCIHDHKLEAGYPVDPLQKRVAQLEKLKRTDNKKRGGGESGGGGGGGGGKQSKKRRGNGGYYAPAGRQPLAGYGDRASYMGMREMYPPTGPNTYNYQVPLPPAYAQQASDQMAFYYQQDDRITPPSYSAAPANYGGY